jgi:putative ABC transport system ATP-binding protein
MDSPQEGSLLIDGVEYASSYPTNQGEWRQANAGLLFQSSNLENSLTVLENVAFPLMLTGVRAHERKKRAMALLVRFHLEKLRHRHPTRLSGGEKQRIALARAMYHNPPILLADEPTGSLNQEDGDQIVDLLFQYVHHNRTVVMVTHNPDYAEKADLLIHIQDGKVMVDKRTGTTPAL